MFQSLAAVAEDHQFQVQHNDEMLRLRIPCSPITLRFEKVSSTTIFGAFYVQTQSWDWPGERSDLNDVISILVGIYLAREGIASCTLIDVPHPAAHVPTGEVYARYLLMSQPNGGYFHKVDDSFPKAEFLIKKFFNLEMFLHQALPLHPDPEELRMSIDAESFEAWRARASGSLGDLADAEEDAYNVRGVPQWDYYRCASRDVSIIQSEAVSDAFDFLWKTENYAILQGVSGDLDIRGDLSNYVPSKDLNELKYLFGKLSTSPAKNEIRTILLENGIVAADQEIVIFLGSSSGRRSFETEKRAVLLRHQNEGQLLFPADSYIWKDRIDGSRFESLVYDLLLREPGVDAVRTIGHANERDGGRDHIAVWHTPYQVGSPTISEEGPITRAREVIVQCKALNRAVGKRQIVDIRDMLDQYDAKGYLVVASGNVGTSAIDYLKSLRKKGDYFTDWWGRSELEFRLRRNPDIARRYSDIIKIISH